MILQIDLSLLKTASGATALSFILLVVPSFVCSPLLGLLLLCQFHSLRTSVRVCHHQVLTTFPMTSRLPSLDVPLHCNICPKQPHFSDISHLLTHIASKGHLSTYYKLKVRAAGEDESRRLVEDYDIWYATWKIEDYMSERMNLKDQKRKPRTRVNGTMNEAEDLVLSRY